MAKFNIGDKVRIKNQPDWPSPPGYIFANAEGTVEQSDFDEVMGEFLPHLAFVKLEKVGEVPKNIMATAFGFLQSIWKRCNG